MRIRFIFLCLLLIALPIQGHAQFIGIGIRIPNASQDGVGNGAIIGGGGSTPNGELTFLTQPLTFNGAILTFNQ